MPRKYMRASAPSGALNPRPRAMAAHRAAEKMLDTTDAITAAANQRRSIAASSRASAAGSAYHTTAASRTRPRAKRPAVRPGVFNGLFWVGAGAGIAAV